ncbi:MAG: methyltransferase [Deltaproteobacteria bacterium]|nr:methyltransferase [Deltaproteobacteria bacterium]
MNDRKPPDIRKPRADDRPLWDIIMGIYGYQAVLLAHDLKLFELLVKKPLTMTEIRDALHIAARPAEALVSACASLGLIEVGDGLCSLSPVAEDYLVEGGPAYFGSFFDLSLAYGVLAFDRLKKAVLTNVPQVYEGADIYAVHEGEAGRARAFARMMHSHSMAPALAWPDKSDLSSNRLMLDVGGGSGAHSIGAALRWPLLRAVVIDLAVVCEVAEEYIASYGLTDRIGTQALDMWNDPYPPADLHFYSDIYHDFTPEKCRFLTRKSFAGLGPGGRIIIHEMLYDGKKTGPFTVAGYNVSMLMWTEGQQFSGVELSLMLEQAGFTDIEVIPTFGYWHIVTGLKP